MRNIEPDSVENQKATRENQNEVRRLSATHNPSCPQCNGRMDYQDDRDEEGNLQQRPWWHCPFCLFNQHLTDAELPESLPAKL